MAPPRGEIDPGVGRVMDALEVMGSPQRELAGRVLHVAGTNGKGSVCALSFSALRQAGLTVGLFTSPHLVEPHDAVKLASGGEDVPLSAQTWDELQREVQEACMRGAGPEAQGPNIELTVFELQVVAVLLLFARSRVDAAVIEVGLGGRDDATNVLVDPAACAVASIGLDHEAFLGGTREAIARHKAGIFQRGRPALIATHELLPSVREVLRECAEASGADPVLWVEPAEALAPVASENSEQSAQRMRAPGLAVDLEVPLQGEFQRSNAALAVAMLLQFRNQAPPLRSRLGGLLDASVLSDRTIFEGLRSAAWPGRLEWCEAPGIAARVLVDGAHNVEAARELGRYVDSAVRSRSSAGAASTNAVAWVVAMSAGKDVQGVLEHLLRDDRDVFVAVPFGKVDGMPWVRPQDPQALRDVAARLRPDLRFAGCAESVAEGLRLATARAEVGATLVVCGSLYLVADFVRAARAAAAT